MIKKITVFIFTFLSYSTYCQQHDITTSLYETYEQFKESNLNKRRIKHHEIQPLILEYRSNTDFVVKKVGESIEGRDLHLISTGSGKIDVFLWSQMHGDEPTATQAIFDILNFLEHTNF